MLDTERIDIFSLLKQIEEQMQTGLLSIQQGVHTTSLYFQEGVIMCVSGSSKHIPIEGRLVSAGFISQARLHDLLITLRKPRQGSLRGIGHDEMQIAEILKKAELVSLEQFRECLIEDVKEIFHDLLTCPTDRTTFNEGAYPPQGRFPLMLTVTALLVLTQDTIVHSVTMPEEQISVSKAGLAKANAAYQSSPDTITSKYSSISLETKAIVKNDRTSILPVVKAHKKGMLKWEIVIIMSILLVTAIAHGLNMFNFPFYNDDEGTYMAQAWAFLHTGHLSHYTYWYDHVPLGWIQIAFWLLITGGLHTFNTAIESGRVLMLLFQIGSTYLLYRIARNVSGSVSVAIIAALLFALSPYSIYYHRRVLLDNISTFWLLLSIFFLFRKRFSLKYVWLAAVALGVSVLSKEITLFLIPSLALLTFCRADKSHRWIAVTGFVAIAGSLISFYVLMAILKGELFPNGVFFWDVHPHVSLIGTLQWQASRSRDGGIFDLHSGFWGLARTWAHDNPILFVGGTICAFFSILLIRKQRMMGLLGLTTFSLILFLARGGLANDFWIVTLLPLFALNIALLVGFSIEGLKYLLRYKTKRSTIFIVQLAMVVLTLGGTAICYTSSAIAIKGHTTLLWTDDQAVGQRQALDWIKVHLSTRSSIVIDDSMWADLHDTGIPGVAYTLAHYYWKVDRDPAITNGVFHNNWRNIDYVVTNPDLLTQSHDNQLALVEGALSHATLLVSFDTGQWPIEIWKVNK